ncbi:MAG: CapA family protein [Bacteroidales bacterium]|nr:CapA family protein [Bacteroidales bacterium]
MRRSLLILLFALMVACTPAKTQAQPQTEPQTDSQTKDSQPADSLLTIAMCGDIMMGTTYPTVRLPQNNGAEIFAHVKQLFLDADLSAGNLEGVIADGGKSTKDVSKANNYAFRTPESYAHLLTEAGFDYLNLANNHTNDFGPEGRQRTREILEKEGIAYSGLPDCESVVVEKNGVRYGICSFGQNSYTLKHTDTASVTRIVTALRPRCDILVVNFHGGAEGTKYSHLPDGPETYLGENRGNLRAFAHRCIDLGADLVFGHGPHVVRAVECYKGHLIAYSLGNFCTTYGINVAGLTGYAPVLVARIARDGSFVEGRIHSFIQTPGTGPLPDLENKVAQHMRALSEADFRGNYGLEISDNGTLTRKTR